MVKLQLLISPEEIHEKVALLGKQIDLAYQGKELVIVMIMKGSICFAADLIRSIHLPTTLEFIQCQSYGHGGMERGSLRILGEELLDLAGKEVLLIDDIFDSGITLGSVYDHLQRKGPRSMKTAVVLSKKAHKKTSFRPDYTLFEIEDRFVVGYGLDYKEHYRGLAAIYTVEEH